MESIGAYLKREREFRQITVREIAEVTRISPVTIEALERDAFEELPGATFVRGYLRAYAEHIGLDAADVMLRYEQEVHPPSDTSTTKLSVAKKRWRWSWKYFWIGVVIAAIIGLAAVFSQL